MPVALIIGISGQDGAYLAKLLVEKGYSVIGTSRDHEVSRFHGLDVLGVRNQVRLTSMAPNDFRSVYRVLRETSPDEIYNLAGQSSVGLSFEQPVEAHESISISVLSILECLRLMGGHTRFYNAGSSECFGQTSGPASEETPFRPRSPYATAKAAAFWTVKNYRDAYAMSVCTGILFNHESPLRPARFVTRKITRAVANIQEGVQHTLHIGNLDARRDWGHARDYVEGMWRILQQPHPDDYVLATGETHSVREFVELAFAEVGRQIIWTGAGVDEQGLDGATGAVLVSIDPRYFRPTEVDSLVGDPTKARVELGWSHRTPFHALVREMVLADLTAVQKN